MLNVILQKSPTQSPATNMRKRESNVLMSRNMNDVVTIDVRANKATRSPSTEIERTGSFGTPSRLEIKKKFPGMRVDKLKQRYDNVQALIRHRKEQD